jgi:uncharacterized protein (TIGR01370 family)
MSDTLAFLYQLQDTNYQSLSTTNFKVAVVDDDNANLTSTNLTSLESQGKNVFGYLSIGEAEDYRSYWTSSWDTSKPSFVLGENPDWPGNYEVKFWDAGWQNIIINRAVELAKEGYNGIVLDVVDVYQSAAVQKAYTGSLDPRAEMMNFVSKIADATHAINPDFKVFQNNALDLVTTNPDDPSSAANTAYLAKISGLVAESTFYDEDNTTTSWGSWNEKYLDKAVANGKTVFAIDYPTSETVQQKFIAAAESHGYIPFIGNMELSAIDSTNYTVMDSLNTHAFDWLTGSTSGGGTTTPTPTPITTPTGTITTMTGHNYNETLTGTSGIDKMYGKAGNDILHGNAGDDYLQGDTGSDKLYGEDGNDKIYGNAGNDSLDGGNGNDSMDGGSEGDYLNGRAGNDSLYGGLGNDSITGGTGTDHLYGGGGNDKFYFTANSGVDTIHDFQGAGASSGDVIYISSAIYSTKAQVMSHITYSGGDAHIHLDGTSEIVLSGVDHGLTSSDFQIY